MFACAVDLSVDFAKDVLIESYSEKYLSGYLCGEGGLAGRREAYQQIDLM